MKCPKCGYVSFEYLDTCRKCGKDLAEFKLEMGVTTFTPAVINVLKYVEGMEEALEEGEEAAVATSAFEGAEEQAVTTDVTIEEEQAVATEEGIGEVHEEPSAKVEAPKKEEIEISLPDDITEPTLEAVEASPQIPAEEKKEEIKLTIEAEEAAETPPKPAPEEKKEEIELTVEPEEAVEASSKSVVEEEKQEIELTIEPEEEKEKEISLTIEEEPKTDDSLSIEVEEEKPPVEELTLSLEDIAELGGEKKDKEKPKHSIDDIKLELE